MSDAYTSSNPPATPYLGLPAQFDVGGNLVAGTGPNAALTAYLATESGKSAYDPPQVVTCACGTVLQIGGASGYCTVPEGTSGHPVNTVTADGRTIVCGTCMGKIAAAQVTAAAG